MDLTIRESKANQSIHNLPKCVDFYQRLLYNIIILGTNNKRHIKMGYLEILGVMWVVTQIFGNDVLMMCVSGCV